MQKFVLCALLLAAPGVARAGVVDIVTRPIEMGGGATYLAFNYNEVGDAWVEERDDNGYTSGDWTTFPRFPLRGLRFDPVSRHISFGRVVCANVAPMAGGFGVFNTGRCRLHSAIRDLGAEGPRLESVTMEVR
jgi:hypothetical protein